MQRFPGLSMQRNPMPTFYPRALSPPADRTYTQGLDRSETDRDGNLDRPGPRQLAADNEFAAG